MRKRVKTIVLRRPYTYGNFKTRGEFNSPRSSAPLVKSLPILAPLTIRFHLEDEFFPQSGKVPVLPKNSKYSDKLNPEHEARRFSPCQPVLVALML
ncbi:hypothetical protein BJP36_11155 [Moorena producens JHB]|uniref:Uncharacterized protein n=1 Tax=Moorena producens (strain JHB) TaxID=1454205 RepID=A0A1D9FYD7_MOOP1|nr:hypothetical protein BJP36_11155 [Moorena producens JHB]